MEYSINCPACEHVHTITLKTHKDPQMYDIYEPLQTKEVGKLIVHCRESGGCSLAFLLTTTLVRDCTGYRTTVDVRTVAA